jgi:hypothetical protein
MGSSKDFCATEEVTQQRRIEDQLIEERYYELVKCRSIDSANNILQVLAIAFEGKIGKRREDQAFRQGQVLAFSVSTRSRGSKRHGKILEPGQPGQGCDD